MIQNFKKWQQNSNYIVKVTYQWIDGDKIARFEYLVIYQKGMLARNVLLVEKKQRPNVKN